MAAAVGIRIGSHLAGHPAWLASIAVLRYAGVTIVDPTTGAIGSVEPLSSGSGEHVAGVFQWSRDVTRPPLDTQAK